MERLVSDSWDRLAVKENQPALFSGSCTKIPLFPILISLSPTNPWCTFFRQRYQISEYPINKHNAQKLLYCWYCKGKRHNRCYAGRGVGRKRSWMKRQPSRFRNLDELPGNDRASCSNRLSARLSCGWGEKSWASFFLTFDSDIPHVHNGGHYRSSATA